MASTERIWSKGLTKTMDMLVGPGKQVFANVHGLAFTRDAQSILAYIDDNLGIKTVRIMAVDNNGTSPEPITNGTAAGARIAALGPLLKKRGMNMIVCLGNAYRGFPGFPEPITEMEGKHTRLAPEFYRTQWSVNYLPYIDQVMNRIIGARNGAIESVSGWEPMNEGQTPREPLVCINWLDKVFAAIRKNDGNPARVLLSGTMGLDHLIADGIGLRRNGGLDRIGQEFLTVLAKHRAIYTLHGYNFLCEGSDFTRADRANLVFKGDMDLRLDLQFLDRWGKEVACVLEEYGTSTETPPYWGEDQQEVRAEWEMTALRGIMATGLVHAAALWSATPTAEHGGDIKRGLSSFSGETKLKMEDFYRKLVPRPDHR